MNLNLDNKVAVVTGAGRGIGKAIALGLAKEKCRVVCLTKSQDMLEKLMGELPNPDHHLGMVFDVTDFEKIEGVFKEISQKMGKIDILINNAGISKPPKFVFQTSETEWDDILTTNLKGYYATIRHATRYLLKNKGGRILNISSVLGQTGAPGLAAYSASKGGVIALTKSLAKELALKNITCNAIAPGYILTDINKDMPLENQRQLLANIPVGRAAAPEEVAPMALFLVSELSAYITGQVFNVDGGLVI